MRLSLRSIPCIVFLIFLFIALLVATALLYPGRIYAQGSGQTGLGSLGMGLGLGGLGMGGLTGISSLGLGGLTGSLGLGGLTGSLGLGGLTGMSSLGVGGLTGGLGMGGLTGMSSLGLGGLTGGLGMGGSALGLTGMGLPLPGGLGMFMGGGIGGGASLMSPMGMSSPFMGLSMPMMGGPGMFLGMMPMMPGMFPLYQAGEPYGGLGATYNYNAAAYGNLIRQQMSNTSNFPGIPVFEGAGGFQFIPPPPIYLPGPLSATITGLVYDEDGNFLEEVKVYVRSDSSISDLTDQYGQYSLRVLGGIYTLVYQKDGYETKYREKINVLGGRTYPQTPVILKEDVTKPPANDPPVLLPMGPIEVIAGFEIELDIHAQDPDNDELTYSYSGWKAEHWEQDLVYVTTEDDIGEHEVTVTVRDPGMLEDSETIVIRVYPGHELILTEGFNLIGYPFENGDPNFSAFDLLQVLGDASQIDSVCYYSNNGDRYVSAWYNESGDPEGTDFIIEISRGYIVYANEDMTRIVRNLYTQGTQDIYLYEGMNLVGFASLPLGYTAFDLLWGLGRDYVLAVYRYNTFWGDWDSAYWLNGSSSGVNFPIVFGEGYHVQMKVGHSLALSRFRMLAW
ncbi:MAG: carboxypeptidase regulatory-like domain-containing protein [bacterium]